MEESSQSGRSLEREGKNVEVSCLGLLFCFI